jgi:RimK-like ATP-grasp domain
VILLWGLPDDGPLHAVHAVLRARREPFGLLDQHRIGGTGIDLVAGAAVHGTLRLDDMSMALEAIDAVYVRPYDIRQVPAMREAGPSSMLWHHGLALEDALRSWVEIAPARIVNRPSAMASNGSKPYQAALIQAAGLDVPDTLVTTDPLAALAFRDRHGTIIYKSSSSVRSIVSRLDEERLDRLANIGNCPTQFQQYIAGTDFRVHVVGDRVFAAEIRSDADDYRYAGRTGQATEIRACALELALRQRCRGLAAALELPVCGIDLRHAPDGRWYCFEINPSPGFTYYQAATGQKIAEAIADLLVGL